MSASSELVMVLSIGLALAFVVVWSAWLQRGSGITAKDPLADASFDFQESWLSTFTGLIAILGTISISSFAFISSGSGTGTSFTILSLFFALLVAGGPLAFKALASANGTGTVGGFLLAAAATLWAAFGVIFSLGMFLLEIGTQVEGGFEGGEPGLATFLMMAIIVILIPMIASYAHSKLTSMLKGRKAFGGVSFL
ncbi:MAG: hypothetical protein M1347_03875 [Chloroflexi bacterium]|nr:hypothetical protein [Chloroflexota bacterium]